MCNIIFFLFTNVFQCHTGVLGCGHYVAYGKMCNDAWWCLNDSSCKEVSGGEANIDKSNAYLLFFEREGLDPDAYLPKFTSEAGQLVIYTILLLIRTTNRNTYFTFHRGVSELSKTKTVVGTNVCQ